MKIVSSPIETIVWFKEKDHPRPVRFRIKEEDGSYTLINVDRILEVHPQKIAGIASLIYRCQSLIDETERRYELKYLIQECRWILYKI
ncbi:hypothetical protein JR334_03060 [Clostridia bacterium]|nr:hypothetical protein JR334_03060 [Clostridia bacterium]